MVSVGVIGFGYWGPNMARNVRENPHMELIAICDKDTQALDQARQRYSGIHFVRRAEELFADDKIDAIIIATPVSTHYELASSALLAGKHVLVEKPMTDSVETAEKLVETAEQTGKILMVDHTFIYSPAVQTLKKIIDGGELGDILYYDSVRINLGLFQHDINVIWDLAPHDVSIMNYTIGRQPQHVSAHGSSHIGNHLESVAHVTLGFDTGFLAHFHVNWLAPVKIRQTLIGGSRKMIVYNDMEPTEKIKIYDRGVDVIPQEGINDTLIQYRTGDIAVPHLENREPLKIEMEHFVDSILNGTTPNTDGKAGLEVVRILGATQQSIEQRGAPVEL